MGTSRNVDADTVMGSAWILQNVGMKTNSLVFYSILVDCHLTSLISIQGNTTKWNLLPSKFIVKILLFVYHDCTV